MWKGSIRSNFRAACCLTVTLGASLMLEACLFGSGSQSSSGGAAVSSSGSSSGTNNVPPITSLYPTLSERQLTQRYFVEMFLKLGRNIPGTNGTYRMVKQPLFKFQHFENHPSTDRIRTVLKDAVNRLTGGVLAATFAGSTEYPAGDWAYVWLDYRTDLGVAAGVTLTGADTKGQVTGGEIHFAQQLYIDKANSSNLDQRDEIVRHELAHLLAGTWHSGLSGNILSYNHTVTQPPHDYADYELTAFQQLYAQPPNTTAKSLLAQGIVTDESMQPMLRLQDFIQIYDKLQPGEVRSTPKGQATAGTKISLLGSGLLYPWGCNEATFTNPKVWINDIQAEIVPFNTYLVQEWPGTCHELTVIVPLNARSGDLKVQVGDYWSNAIPITVVSP